MTGPYLENQQELVHRMIDDGHIVGNHTVNHPNLPKQSVETEQKELSDLNKMCEGNVRREYEVYASAGGGIQ